MSQLNSRGEPIPCDGIDRERNSYGNRRRYAEMTEEYLQGMLIRSIEQFITEWLPKMDDERLDRGLLWHDILKLAGVLPPTLPVITQEDVERKRMSETLITLDQINEQLDSVRVCAQECFESKDVLPKRRLAAVELHGKLFKLMRGLESFKLANPNADAGEIEKLHVSIGNISSEIVQELTKL